MHIGFIGIGNMGSEQARHLLAAGHTLTTYARLRVRASAFGLSLVDTPAEVAAASEVIFTIVTAGKDVEAIVAGYGGSRMLDVLGKKWWNATSPPVSLPPCTTRISVSRSTSRTNPACRCRSPRR